MKYDIRRLKTWRRVGIACLVLVISGIVGWLFEFICGFFHSGMSTLSWQGGNFLPWINMYSIGAFIILFTSYRFRNSPLKVFLISALFTGLFELISGFILEQKSLPGQTHIISYLQYSSILSTFLFL